MRAIVLILLFLGGGVFAVDLPETLTVGSTTFQHVVYVSHTPATVTFEHTGGKTTVNIADMPESVKKSLDFSLVGAWAFEAKEKAKKALEETKAATEKAANDAAERNRKWADGPEIPPGATISEEKFRAVYSIRGVVVAHVYEVTKQTPPPIGSDPYAGIGRKLEGVSYEPSEVETLNTSRKVLVFGLTTPIADGDDFKASVADVGVQRLAFENLHAFRVIKLLEQSAN